VSHPPHPASGPLLAIRTRPALAMLYIIIQVGDLFLIGLFALKEGGRRERRSKLYWYNYFTT
jgi:hypothetical protein